jgi:hypothetical protein
MAGFRLSVLIAIGLFLPACSGTYKSYIDMFQVALASKQDVNLSYKTLLEAPNDFLYVRSGDQPQAALGLMYIEQNQYKWISASKELLVTERGRIVRTSGLANDLLHLSNRLSDPLKAADQAGASWLRSADWQNGEYGYVIRSDFQSQAGHYLTFFNQQIAVTKVVETLHYDNPSSYWRFDGSWQNVFWLDATTGAVLQSQQQLAPGMAPLQLIFISEVVRHLQRTGVVIPEDAT